MDDQKYNEQIVEKYREDSVGVEGIECYGLDIIRCYEFNNGENLLLGI